MTRDIERGLEAGFFRYEASIGQILKAGLEMHGFTVRYEACSTDTIKACLEFHPDLILLDIDMPVKDGGQVASELRSHPTLRHTPVMFLTSRVSKEETGEAERVPRDTPVQTNSYCGVGRQDSCRTATTDATLNCWCFAVADGGNTPYHLPGLKHIIIRKIHRQRGNVIALGLIGAGAGSEHSPACSDSRPMPDRMNSCGLI